MAGAGLWREGNGRNPRVLNDVGKEAKEIGMRKELIACCTPLKYTGEAASSNNTPRQNTSTFTYWRIISGVDSSFLLSEM
jgi:hypothetical protein